MTVQSLKGRARKGKTITAAGWFEDGTIRYVVYEPTRGAQIPADLPPDPVKSTSRRGALAAEQRDLFGGS